MAQDWSVHAVVYFCSAIDDLSWAVFYWRLDLEFTDMKTIIEMAREAGDDWDHTLKEDRKFLEAFEALVRADEREACAKVAEDMDAMVLALLNVTRQPIAIAAAIRARGQA